MRGASLSGINNTIDGNDPIKEHEALRETVKILGAVNCYCGKKI